MDGPTSLIRIRISLPVLDIQRLIPINVSSGTPEALKLRYGPGPMFFHFEITTPTRVGIYYYASFLVSGQSLPQAPGHRTFFSNHGRLRPHPITISHIVNRWC